MKSSLRLSSTTNVIFVQNLSRMLRTKLLKCRKKIAQVIVSSIILVLVLCLLQIDANEEPEFDYEYDDNVTPSPDYINVQKINFIKNSPKCSSSSMDKLLLVIVHSSRSNLIKRVVLRNYLGSIKYLNGWSLHLIFILGIKRSTIEEFTIEDNDDLVIGDFEDSYRNMSYKHMMGYRWALEYCPEAKYILKIDDDVVINYFKLIDLLERETVSQNQNASIICYGYQDTRVSRQKDGKNSVTFKEYYQEDFPEFCVGMAYIVNLKAAQIIYLRHSVERFFWIDDVWVTGILRKDLQMRNISDLYYFFYKPTKYSKDVYDLLSWYKNPYLYNELPWIFYHIDEDPSRINEKERSYSVELRMIYLWNKIKKVQHAHSVLGPKLHL